MKTHTLGATGLAITLLATLAVHTAQAHCQIPCGIYDDPTRAVLMAEHITTLEKSMKEIVRLSAETTPDISQIARWTANKEVHAEKLNEIITAYFMAQRIKPADPADAAAHATYVQQVTLLHRMLVTTMKSKQTTDLKHIEALRTLLKEFAAAYPGITPAGH